MLGWVDVIISNAGMACLNSHSLPDIYVQSCFCCSVSDPPFLYEASNIILLLILRFLNIGMLDGSVLIIN